MTCNGAATGPPIRRPPVTESVTGPAHPQRTIVCTGRCMPDCAESDNQGFPDGRPARTTRKEGVASHPKVHYTSEE